VSLAPRAVFDDFTRHIAHFTAPSDCDVEDQFFDRKEIPVPSGAGNVASGTIRDIREQIRETVSAFANTNPEGGLLVLGISKSGEIVGVNHLTDQQRNSLTSIGQLLRNQSASVRLEECTDSKGITGDRFPQSQRSVRPRRKQLDNSKSRPTRMLLT
jgi:hypothetical protein